MIDTTILSQHIEKIAKEYPEMNILQLGIVVLLLGSLRSTMGHEHANGTLKSYIHKEYMSKDVVQCIDFIERELLGTRESKLDIDVWKRGNVPSYKDT